MPETDPSERLRGRSAAASAARGGPFIGAITLSVMATACASTGAIPRPFPTAGRATASQIEPEAPAGRHALIDTALQLQGAPYRDRGSDPGGFDCSGFTQYVFAQHGIVLPREVHNQFTAGREVETNDLAPGDLLFFSTSAPGASHVAILVERDQFVHAPSSTGVVRIERLSAPYWSRRFLGARRID